MPTTLILGLCYLSAMFCIVSRVVSEVCNETYHQSEEITAIALVYEKRGSQACQYDIRPSKNFQMILNFTNISFFSTPWSHDNAKLTTNSPRETSSRYNTGANKCGTSSQVAAGSDRCLPYIEIVSYNVSECVHTNVVCEANMNYQSPQVFHSNSEFLKITFKWIPGQNSQFILDLKMEEKPAKCDQGWCQDGSCLLHASLQCDGTVHCLDGSDEVNCPDSGNNRLSSGAQISSGKQSLLHYVIPLSAAILIFCIVIACVCCIKAWKCRMGECRQSHTSFVPEFDQLHSCDSSPEDQCSNVVYLPSNRNMDADSPSKGSKLQQNRGRLHPSQPTNPVDPKKDLPPFIPMSEDGEEGYANSQRHLTNLNLCYHQNLESIRSPPNRTIYGRESPPMYRSNPYRLIDKENGKGPTRIVKNNNGETVLVRCYTMANNNEYLLSRSVAVENSRLSHSVGHTRNLSGCSGNSSISGDPPPGYSEVMSEANSTVFTRGSSSSI